MMQDLVIHGADIAFAIGVLMTFGLILTWVERKQAAVMSDRIGANRAYLRIPFTNIKLVWWGDWLTSTPPPSCSHVPLHASAS